MLITATRTVSHPNEIKPTASVFEYEFRELQLQLSAAFDHSPYRSIKDIEFNLRDGVIVMLGRVPSFFLKQLAQTLASEIIQARLELKNEVAVSDRTAELALSQNPTMVDGLRGD